MCGQSSAPNQSYSRLLHLSRLDANPLESALTSLSTFNSFRICTYRKGGRGLRLATMSAPPDSCFHWIEPPPKQGSPTISSQGQETLSMANNRPGNQVAEPPSQTKHPAQ